MRRFLFSCLAIFVMLFLIDSVNAQTTIQNNKIIVNPAVNGKPAPETPSQKVTRVYANHALSTLCTQSYMERFEDLSWSAGDRSIFWKTYQTGCKCLATEILTVAEPADVVDFARENFATPSKKSLPYNDKKVSAIAILYSSPLVLKKCNLPN
jgi:hypothetical protein